MRFRNETKPPAWLNRHEQRRVFSFLIMLMLVIVSVDLTRRPENWNWFFELSDSGDQQKRGPLDEIDFRVKEPSPALPLPAFVAVAEEKPVPADDETSPPDIHQVPKQFLKGIEDQRIGRLRSEEGALKKTLQQVSEFSQSQLLAAGRRDVGFRVINVEPEIYRGELLRLDGRLWRLAPYSYGDPGETKDDLVQAWMFTEDSGNNPWVVILAEKPRGLEFGNALDRRVQVAGYFFKRFGYPTEEGMHVAPMLIGKTLTIPTATPVEQRETIEVTYYVVGALAGIACLFGILIGYFYLSDRKYKRSQAARIAAQRLDPSESEKADLDQLTTTDPAETFRKLRDEFPD